MSALYVTMTVLLLAPIWTGQRLDDFKVFGGLFIQHPIADVEGEVRVECHTH